MSATSWYYAQSGKRSGPISLEEMRNLSSSGALRREDLVWTVGMSQWAAAATVPQIFDSHQADASPAPAAAVSAPLAVAAPVDDSTLAASPVGYFNPSAGMPPRAAATLLGHAFPTGDTADWPLDDARVEQFEKAFKLRKKVTAAAQLYRALLVLTALGGIIM